MNNTGDGRWGNGQGRRDGTRITCKTYLDLDFRVVSPEPLPDAVLIREPLPSLRLARLSDGRAELVDGQDGERHPVAAVGSEAALARANGAHRVLDVRPLPRRLKLERRRELVDGQREAEREAHDVRAGVRVRGAARPDRDLVVRELELLFERHFVLVDYSVGTIRLTMHDQMNAR